MRRKLAIYLVVCAIVAYGAFVLHRVSENAGAMRSAGSTREDVPMVSEVPASMEQATTEPTTSPTTSPATSQASSATRVKRRLNWSSKNIERLSKGKEAVQWLKANPNPEGFATERFGSTKQAIRFVEMLYAAGAQVVIVPDEAVEMDDAAGPYADALVIYLPKNSEQSRALRKICDQEIIRSHGEPKDQKSQEAMLVWFE